MKNDVIIVGSGPIGLNLAAKLAKLKLNVLILEQSDSVGGQITSLYPEKTIYDIPGIKCIKGKDYVNGLFKLVSKNGAKPMLNEQVISFDSSFSGVTIQTKSNVFQARFLVLCCGLGYYAPRKLDLQNEDDFSNIHYSLQDPQILKNKNVVILGGGDSAIDWTRELSEIAKNVTIVHRRDEFRGDVTPIRGLSNVSILTPFVPKKLSGDNSRLTSLIIENVETKERREIFLDSLLVNFGSLPPQKENFNLDYDGSFVVTDGTFKTRYNNVFALGDMTTYENKIRRIAPGLEETEALIQFLFLSKFIK